MNNTKSRITHYNDTHRSSQAFFFLNSLKMLATTDRAFRFNRSNFGFINLLSIRFSMISLRIRFSNNPLYPNIFTHLFSCCIPLISRLISHTTKRLDQVPFKLL